MNAADRQPRPTPTRDPACCGTCAAIVSAATRDPEFSYEVDGGPIAVHLPGHGYGEVEALVAACEFWLDEEAQWGDDGPETPDAGFATPRKVWLRKVPGYDGQIMHYYQGHAARGARPITLVEVARESRMCRACGKPATTGFDGDGGHYLYADHPADLDRFGQVWLCAEHAAIVTGHRRAIWSACNDPCPNCGHSLGRHERFGKGPELPCGFAFDTNGCPCTDPSPHSAAIDFEDLRGDPS